MQNGRAMREIDDPEGLEMRVGEPGSSTARTYTVGAWHFGGLLIATPLGLAIGAASVAASINDWKSGGPFFLAFGALMIAGALMEARTALTLMRRATVSSDLLEFHPLTGRQPRSVAATDLTELSSHWWENQLVPLHIRTASSGTFRFQPKLREYAAFVDDFATSYPAVRLRGRPAWTAAAQERRRAKGNRGTTTR
jgi:hypothetical protein